MITEVAVTENSVVTNYADKVPSGQNVQNSLATLVHQLLLNAVSANPVVPFSDSSINPIYRQNVTDVSVTWG